MTMGWNVELPVYFGVRPKALIEDNSSSCLHFSVELSHIPMKAGQPNKSYICPFPSVLCFLRQDVPSSMLSGLLNGDLTFVLSRLKFFLLLFRLFPSVQRQERSVNMTMRLLYPAKFSLCTCGSFHGGFREQAKRLRSKPLWAC